MKPHVLKQVLGAGRQAGAQGQARRSRSTRRRSASNLATMKSCAGHGDADRYGARARFAGFPVTVAGKTGTAQVPARTTGVVRRLRARRQPEVRRRRRRRAGRSRWLGRRSGRAPDPRRAARREGHARHRDGQRRGRRDERAQTTLVRQLAACSVSSRCSPCTAASWCSRRPPGMTGRSGAVQAPPVRPGARAGAARRRVGVRLPHASQGWVGPLLVLDAFLILSPRIPGSGNDRQRRDVVAWRSAASGCSSHPSRPSSSRSS